MCTFCLHELPVRSAPARSAGAYVGMVKHVGMVERMYKTHWYCTVALPTRRCHRVYERSAADEQEAAFYRKWEGEATRGAVLSTALSGSDASHLQAHLEEGSHDVMVRQQMVHRVLTGGLGQSGMVPPIATAAARKRQMKCTRDRPLHASLCPGASASAQVRHGSPAAPGRPAGGGCTAAGLPDLLREAVAGKAARALC